MAKSNSKIDELFLKTTEGNAEAKEQLSTEFLKLAKLTANSILNKYNIRNVSLDDLEDCFLDFPYFQLMPSSFFVFFPALRRSWPLAGAAAGHFSPCSHSSRNTPLCTWSTSSRQCSQNSASGYMFLST